MCKDFLSLLQDQDDISTVWVLEKTGWMLLCGGRGRRHSDYRWRRFWWQEGCLKERPLDISEVRFPKLQVATGNERCSDSIIKDVLDSKLSDNTSFIIWHSQLFGYLPASFWRKNLTGFNWSEK